MLETTQFYTLLAKNITNDTEEIFLQLKQKYFGEWNNELKNFYQTIGINSDQNGQNFRLLTITDENIDFIVQYTEKLSTLYMTITNALSDNVDFSSLEIKHYQSGDGSVDLRDLNTIISLTRIIAALPKGKSETLFSQSIQKCPLLILSPKTLTNLFAKKDVLTKLIISKANNEKRKYVKTTFKKDDRRSSDDIRGKSKKSTIKIGKRRQQLALMDAYNPINPSLKKPNNFLDTYINEIDYEGLVFDLLGEELEKEQNFVTSEDQISDLAQYIFDQALIIDKLKAKRRLRNSRLLGVLVYMLDAYILLSMIIAFIPTTNAILHDQITDILAIAFILPLVIALVDSIRLRGLLKQVKDIKVPIIVGPYNAINWLISFLFLVLMSGLTPLGFTQAFLIILGIFVGLGIIGSIVMFFVRRD